MELTELRYLRWALVAWPVLEVVSGIVTYSPRIFWIALVQALILWACYNAISKGSKTARVVLTVFAGLQIAGGIWFMGPIMMTNGTAFSLVLLAIVLRGAVIALANGANVRAIQPSPPAHAPLAPEHDHEWRPHARLDGWTVCSTCGKVEARAGTVAAINQSES